MIEQCSKDFPDRFSTDFYCDFVLEANFRNPRSIFGKKQRGTFYGLDKEKMTEIRYSATHVYVFLSYWVKHEYQGQSCPVFDKINKKYNITPEKLTSITQKLLDDYFKIGLLKIKDPTTFYNNFIARKKTLGYVRKLYEHLKYTPPIVLNRDGSSNYSPSVQPLMKILKPHM